MYTKKSLIFLFFISVGVSAAITSEQKHIDTNTVALTLAFKLAPSELLYKDSISISVDNPHVIIASIQAEPEALYRYDELSKQKKLAYADTVTFNVHATKNADRVTDAQVHMLYQTSKRSAPQQEIVRVAFDSSHKTTPVQPVAAQQPPTPTTSTKTKRSLTDLLWNTSQYISDLLHHTKSLPVQLILVFLLGILLSLTPCIYPMIPITIGVLHNQQKGSFVHNFMRALSYTLGVALTFASLGYCASCMQFTAGTLLVNPFFVLPLVALLAYLAFSMFGFYEMYIPRFLQQQQRTTDGSLLSAFLFGAASGTIASPCVSPGLALVLSMAAVSGSALLGFVLLFIFGVGLSTPLLIVGTFSSSLNLLPRSGAWMLEVKKVFGLLLLAVCFYYLSNIWPLYIVLLLLAATMFGFGIYYVQHAFTLRAEFWKKINLIVGVAFIIGALVLTPHAYFLKFKQGAPTEHIWLKDYAQARQLALQERKKLFIDFWAQYCSICKTINSTVFTDESVVSALKEFVPVMIDGTNEADEQYKQLKEKYSIAGFPTYLLVDPETETVLKKWGSELYHMPREQFVEELKQFTLS